MSRFIFICLVGFAVAQCADPFAFEVLGTEELLVIDASFTNERKSHEVRISSSFALDEEEEQLVRGATIWVEDSDGSRIPFTENAEGSYKTAEDVAGVVGEGYVLHIQIGDRELVSSVETMLAPIPIDSIYGRYIGLPFDDGSFQFGIQFLLDARGSTDQARSYRFDFEETHRIWLPYGSLIAWDSETSTSSLRDTILNNCYSTGFSRELLISTTDGLADNSVLEFPLRFVSEQDPELRSRYSLIVRQHAISASTYQFYREVKETNESAGSFFDEQKGRIAGNIQDVNDPTFAVLGYFEVAAVSEARRVFSREDFFEQGFRPGFDNTCADQLDTIPQPELPDFFASFVNFNIYQFDSEPPNPAIVGPGRCTDCRNFGVLRKPDFWP